MKLGKLVRGLGAAVKFAGPAVAGFAAGGPAGAGLAVVGQLSGGAEKRRGKEAERKAPGGRPIHKATAPAAAIGIPAVVAPLAAAAGLDLSGGLGVLCAGGELTAAGVGFLMGLLALVSHTVGSGIQKSTQSRR